MSKGCNVVNSFLQHVSSERDNTKSESFSEEKDMGFVREVGCLSIIVLGASGDLAKKKTFPALFHLFAQGFLQENDVHIFGYARTKLSDDDLRARIRGYLQKGVSAEQEDVLSRFLLLIKYVSGSYDSADGFQLLNKAISEHEISKKSHPGISRRLFYLALPPSVYPSVCRMIRQNCMNPSDLGGWTRIVVEKPFGKDLNSAEDLSALCKELQVALCKELTKSDVGNTGRIVLPKREAEACLPPLSERDGIVLHMEDMALQCSWKFKYRYLQKGVSSEQEDVLSRFLQLIKYVSGSYDSADGFQTFSLSFMQEY